jgi:hypothetical protein
MLATLLTLCVVVFLYLHVVYYLKRSNEMDLYDVDVQSKSQLEEACGMRQPFVFNYDCGVEVDWEKHKNADLNVVDLSGVRVDLPVSKALKLFPKSPHYSDHNDKLVADLDFRAPLLRPPLCVCVYTDLLCGSDGVNTKFKYNDSFRNYLAVVQGSVKVRLGPPSSAMTVEKDYFAYDFSSPDPCAKVVETALEKGQTLFVPAYWWYSVTYGPDSCVASFRYKTALNCVATLPDLVLALLQRQNTRLFK